MMLLLLEFRNLDIDTVMNTQYSYKQFKPEEYIKTI